MKRQTVYWEKGTYIIKLVFRIENSNCTIKKQTTPLKWSKNFNKHFIKINR